MQLSIPQRWISHALEWLIPILCFGYTLQVSIPVFFGINTNQFNIAVRAFYLGISLILICLSFFKPRVNRFSFGSVFFILFWIAYSFRLYYDLEILDLGYMDQDKYYVYAFAFGNSFFPSLAILLHHKSIDLDRLNINTWYLCLVSNTILFFWLLFVFDYNIFEILATRAAIYVNKGTLLELSIINPITVSYLGEITALQGFLFLLLGFDKKYRLKKAFIYVGIVLGIANLILGASRGPMIVFVLLLLVIIYFRIRRIPNAILFINKLSIWIFIAFVGIISYLVPKISSQNIELESINRLLSFKETRDNSIMEDRDFEMASAWQQFLNSPVWGDRFINRYDDTYPHNLILDVLMSTGIIGMCCFVLIYFFVIKNIFKLIKKIAFLPTFILFLSIVFSSMLSGSIFQGILTWIFTALLLSM